VSPDSGSGPSVWPTYGSEPLPDQVERTQLAWRRTALSLVATGLLVAHLAGGRDAPVGLALVLVGVSAVVGYVWLGGGRRVVGAAALAMVLGVALLAGLALHAVLVA